MGDDIFISGFQKKADPKHFDPSGINQQQLVPSHPLGGDSHPLPGISSLDIPLLYSLSSTPSTEPEQNSQLPLLQSVTHQNNFQQAGCSQPSSVLDSYVGSSCMYAESMLNARLGIDQVQPEVDLDKMRKTCPHCDQVFESNEKFTKHVNQHGRVKSLACGICQHKFFDLKGLKGHMATHSGARPFLCTFCGKRFRTARILKDHNRTHTGERPYVCEVCGKGFSLASTLKKHRITHTGEKPYQCSQCQSKFGSTNALRYHIRTRHQLLYLPSSQCSVGIEGNEKLGETLQLPSQGGKSQPCRSLDINADYTTPTSVTKLKKINKGLYTCLLCGQSYADAKDFSKHLKAAHKKGTGCRTRSNYFVLKMAKHKVRMVDGKSMYRCDRCGQQYRLAKGLYNHLPMHVNPVQVTCAVCKKLCISRDTLSEHMASHRKEIICALCNKVSKGITNYRAHQKTHSKLKGHKCLVCGKGFASRNGLLQHRMEHKDKKEFKCNLCHKKFQFKACLYLHKQAMHNPNHHHHKCHSCGKVFASRSYLSKHKMLHFEKKPFTCKVCDKKFSLCRNYKRHILIHGEARENKCVKCNMAFFTRSELTSHIQKNHPSAGNVREHGTAPSEEFTSSSSLGVPIRGQSGNLPHECHICYRSFVWPSALTAHLKTHLDEKPFRCPYCPKSFVRDPHLTVHIRTHTGEKPYICDVCGRGFSDKGNLTRHQALHNEAEKRPFSCTECDKSFLFRSQLDVHMYSHGAEKPHKCSFCPKTFGRPAHLERHVRTHTGEKPFQCSICNNFFSDKGNLRKHTLTHFPKQKSEKGLDSGEPQSKAETPRMLEHRCDVCGKLFARIGHLNRHRVTHTGEKPYQCDICQSSFNDPGNLKRHMKKHQRVEMGRSDSESQQGVYTHQVEFLYDVASVKSLAMGGSTFQCDVCQVSFRDKSNLQIHMLKHAQEINRMDEVYKSALPKDIGGGNRSHGEQNVRALEGTLCGNAYGISNGLGSQGLQNTEDSRVAQDANYNTMLYHTITNIKTEQVNEDYERFANVATSLVKEEHSTSASFRCLECSYDVEFGSIEEIKVHMLAHHMATTSEKAGPGSSYARLPPRETPSNQRSAIEQHLNVKQEYDIKTELL